MLIVLLFVLVCVWGRDIACRYFININNNVNTSSIKTIANTTSSPLYTVCRYVLPLHCPRVCVVEGSSWTGMASIRGVWLLSAPFVMGVLPLSMMVSDMVVLLAGPQSLWCCCSLHDLLVYILQLPLLVCVPVVIAIVMAIVGLLDLGRMSWWQCFW